MDRQALSGGVISSLCFALCSALGAGILALDIKELLDELSGQPNGGLAYGVCFLLCGLSLTGLSLYSAYLFWSEWNSRRLIRGLKLAVEFSALVALLCTIWFCISPGYMNPAGIAGLLGALATAAWVRSICNRLIESLDR